ncbi:MAG TPA: 2-phospho-L-lactate transferase [Hyphomicrobiaceae bacterium]|nr:2-phospho-L-lactate transferase [Hyphomicrobiaceae bacterium]
MSSYVALCGGVGGAKLALGLSHIVPPENLTIVVNTGDDFEHVGLHVSPDIDTVLYTLSGLANPEQGWGLAGETWGFMAALERLGGPTWFKLGDHDLATHAIRTERLRQGESLSSITDSFRRRLGIGPAIVPMSDDPVRTMVHTDLGRLAFQSYFVEHRCAPRVARLEFTGAEAARPAPGALNALARPDLAGVIICPSNPWLSVDPMLAIPGLRAALEACPAPRIAVTPIVAGQAIKGPTAKIMGELGLASGAGSIVEHYGKLLDGFVLDTADQALAGGLGLPVSTADTIMRTLDDRIRVAQAAVELCRGLAASRAGARENRG